MSALQKRWNVEERGDTGEMDAFRAYRNIPSIARKLTSADSDSFGDIYGQYTGNTLCQVNKRLIEHHDHQPSGRNISGDYI